MKPNAKYTSIYLAGACKHVKDEGKTWRAEARVAFQMIEKYNGVQICVIDPTEYFSYSTPVHKTDKQVKNYYMSRIRKCDILLANLVDSALSPGTAQEVQFAVDNNIPVISFGHENTYPWLENVDSDIVFDNLQEAIRYIKEYYIL